MTQKIIRTSPEYSDIDEIIQQYHFPENQKCLIKSLYQKHFSKPQVQLTYHINPEIPGINLASYAVAILTLGQQTDDIINTYLEKQQIMEAYIMDAISLKIMSRAYETMVQEINKASGMTATSLEFLGDRFPINLTKDIVDYLQPEGITLAEGFMLKPLKTVCVIIPLTGDKTDLPVENLCNTCTSCGNLNCVMRATN